MRWLLGIEAHNLTDRPVRIIKVRLIRPKANAEVVHADASLPLSGSPYWSDRHPVPPHDTVAAHLHIMVRGRLAREGKSARVTLGITDQFGDEYQPRKLLLRTLDATSRRTPWLEAFAKPVRRLVLHRKEIVEQREFSAKWEHGGKFEDVDIVLKEESRAYAAHGRRVGGLGTLSAGLPGGQNVGEPMSGGVPSLLCDRAHAKLVDSPHVGRLMKLIDTGTEDLEGYLLSHLHKNSPYADVAYLIFLALHRMDRTVEALSGARKHLAGDSVYAYSNVIATLSATIYFEHSDFDPALYPRILAVIEGDSEYDFGLKQRINQARLQHLDLSLASDSSGNNSGGSAVP
jgi:hypothetical protein